MNAFIFPVVFVTVSLTGAIIDWISQRRRKVRPTVEQGFARYPGTLMSWGIAIGLLALTFPALLVARPDARSEWPIILPAVIVSLGLSYYCIHKWLVTRWEWDAEGVTFVSGKRTTRLPWAAIISGKWLIGGWRITGLDGSISCWHTVTGHDVLSDALIKHRPDLAGITLLRS